MLYVFAPVIVANEKTLNVYNFAAPLTISLINIGKFSCLLMGADFTIFRLVIFSVHQKEQFAFLISLRYFASLLDCVISLISVVLSWIWFHSFRWWDWMRPEKVLCKRCSVCWEMHVFCCFWPWPRKKI